MVHFDAPPSDLPKPALEQAKALIEGNVSSLPSILKTPFSKASLSLVMIAQTAYAKSQAATKLAASTTTPKSARIGFKLSASAAIKEAPPFAALQQQAVELVKSHEAAYKALIVSCAELEVTAHQETLMKAIMKTVSQLSTLFAMDVGTEIIGVEEYGPFRMMVFDGLYNQLRKTAIVGATLTGVSQQDYLVQCATVTSESAQHDWFDFEYGWSNPHQTNCVRILINVLLRPIDKLSTASTEMAAKLAISKQWETYLTDGATADATMAVDNEAAATPKIVAKMIDDKIAAGIRKAIKTLVPQGNLPKAGNQSKSKSKKSKSKSKSKSGMKPDDDDDDASTTPRNTNTRGGNNNSNNTRNRNNKDGQKTSSTANAGNGTGGANAGASSTNKKANKKARGGDNDTPAASGKKRGANAPKGRSRSKSNARRND